MGRTRLLLCGVLAAAVALRAWVLLGPGLGLDRVQLEKEDRGGGGVQHVLNSELTEWSAVKECLAHWQADDATLLLLGPYRSPLCHVSPVIIHALRMVTSWDWGLRVAGILADVITGVLLYCSMWSFRKMLSARTRRMLPPFETKGECKHRPQMKVEAKAKQNQEEEGEEYGQQWETELEARMLEEHRPAGLDLSEFLGKTPARQGLVLCALYLFNPVTLWTLRSGSLQPLVNCVMVLSIFLAMRGRLVLSALALSVLAQHRMHFLPLVVPLSLLAREARALPVDSAIRKQKHGASWIVALVWVLGGGLLMAAFTGLFTAINVQLTAGSWAFVQYAHLWGVLDPVLRPNIGLGWYLFAETFEKFRLYFLLVFNLHPLIYVCPLAIRLEHSPLAMTHVLLGILLFFTAAPTLGDLSLFVPLLLMHVRALRWARRLPICCVLLSAPIVFIPEMLKLWLRTGSGNSNFVFFQTLAFCILLGTILAELTSVYVRQWHAYHVAIRGPSSSTKS